MLLSKTVGYPVIMQKNHVYDKNLCEAYWRLILLYNFYCYCGRLFNLRPLNESLKFSKTWRHIGDVCRTVRFVPKQLI